MTPTEILARAHSARDKGILYRLGMGGYDPAAPLPSTRRVELLPPRTVQGCDCSGFVAWCCGVSRDPAKRKDKLWPKWFETTNIWTDAKKARLRFGLVPMAELQPGDVVVYPDHKDAAGGHREGHIAVVADPLYRLIIDCSSSQSSKTGQAITLRPGDFFWRNPMAVGARWKGGDAA